ncbi:DUF2218 domain-containing protein [Streptomyces sp. NPDC088350]|uniref:DUF2218 domain-containing protein n=1 Tax=Streptomyces sp. NPDC088350 TaxID=3365854 RepID=UPI00380A0B2A
MPMRADSERTKAPALRLASPERNALPTSEARISTDRASRYLTQLCRHSDQMGRRPHYRPRAQGGGDAPPKVEHTEWSDTHGVIRFARGQCTMQATQNTLTLRAEATDEDNLRQIQAGIAGRLETMGRRDQLTVTWQRPEAAEPEPGHGAAGPLRLKGSGALQGRWPVKKIALIVVGVLVVSVHLGLFGAVLTTSPWTDWAANAVLALVLLKAITIAAHIVPARLAIRRRKRRPAPVSQAVPDEPHDDELGRAAPAKLGSKTGDDRR